MTSRPIAETGSDHNRTLAAHVHAIRVLGKQTVEGIIEIGRRLTECKGIVGHRNFGCWLNNEFSWSERTAQNFMRVFELSKSESANFTDLDLPVSSLYLLAAPSTPEPAREEILTRAKAGEPVPVAEVKRIVARVKVERSRARFVLPTSPVRTQKSTRRVVPPEDAVAQKDIGPDSSAEIARKLARLDELENLTRAQATKIIGLENEIGDLQDACKPKPVSKGEGTTVYCSFCGKSHHDVATLIASSGAKPISHICDGCITVCSDILRERQTKPAAAAEDVPPFLDRAAQPSGKAPEQWKEGFSGLEHVLPRGKPH